MSKIIRQLVGNQGIKTYSGEVGVTTYGSLPRSAEVKDFDAFIHSTVDANIYNDNPWISDILEAFSFVDPCLITSQGLVDLNQDKSLKAEETYYLAAEVKLQTKPLYFRVKLQGEQRSDGQGASTGQTYEKLIEEFYIPTITTDDNEAAITNKAAVTTTIETLFTVNDTHVNWNRVVFEVVRQADDFASGVATKLYIDPEKTETGSSGTVYTLVEGGWKINDKHCLKDKKDPEDSKPHIYVKGSWLSIPKGPDGIVFRKLNNIILKSNNDYVEKIAIQGTPGMFFALDGEPFRIGRTGLFELEYRTLNLKRVAVYKRDDNDFFLIDYKEVIDDTATTNKGGN